MTPKERCIVELMRKHGPPSLIQLARDLWLADIGFAAACDALGSISAKQRGAVLTIYSALNEEERSLNGKVTQS